MKALFQTIEDYLINKTYDQMLKYYKNKYGQRTDLVYVWGEKNNISFKSSRLNKSMDKIGLRFIRTTCADNTLLGFGPRENNPIYLVLVAFPSLIKTIGLKEYINFIKEWSGSGKIGDKEVLYYLKAGQ